MTRNSILFFAASVLYLSGCHSGENVESEEIKYTITSPAVKDTTIYKEYVCQVHSIQHIELRALEKGYLQSIYVDEGQHVSKGQLMFQITPSIYQADLQSAQAEVSFAEVEYRNTKSLADSNIVSSNELLLAKARLDKAKAELTLAETHLSFTEIRAPFDGIVDRFHVRLGSLIEEGELLTSLSDNSKMWVYFNVPEVEYLNYATSPQADSLLKVKLQMANHELFDEVGIVETIEADFNNETGNIAFRATFQNPKSILRHGETGNILMPVHLNKALMIPQKATFEILDKKFVYVLDDQNVIQSREITVTSEIPHLYVVGSGLSENDVILVDGLRKVKNGDVVKGNYRPLGDLIAELKAIEAE